MIDRHCGPGREPMGAGAAQRSPAIPIGPANARPTSSLVPPPG